MRNRNVKLPTISFFLILGAISLTGCGLGAPRRRSKTRSWRPVIARSDQHQSDLAIQQADDYLRQQPDQPSDAEAASISKAGALSRRPPPLPPNPPKISPPPEPPTKTP